MFCVVFIDTFPIYSVTARSAGPLVVVSGVPQGSVLGPLLFLLYTFEFYSILENKLVNYADGSTFMAVVPSPGIRVTVVESLNHGLSRVSEWCNLWEMKLNVSKTKTMIVSKVMHNAPPVTSINYWRNCAEGVCCP